MEASLSSARDTANEAAANAQAENAPTQDQLSSSTKVLETLLDDALAAVTPASDDAKDVEEKSNASLSPVATAVDLWGALIVAGSAGFILCLMPQLYRTLQRRSAEDLSPLGVLVADLSAKRRRAQERNPAADAFDAGLHRRHLELVLDLVLQPGDDVDRRAGGCEQAVPH